MPAATALAVGCAAWALLRARRLLAPTGGDPGWRAAVWGAIAAGAVGALVEDSGPLLLVVAVFTGGCVCSYLWGRPRPAAPAKPPAEALLTRPAERELALSPATLCAGGSRTARRRR
jgi:glyoxylase-like metal-dependent hydrolase (beta-lactamase superfamily II)